MIIDTGIYYRHVSGILVEVFQVEKNIVHVNLHAANNSFTGEYDIEIFIKEFVKCG